MHASKFFKMYRISRNKKENSDGVGSSRGTVKIFTMQYLCKNTKKILREHLIPSLDSLSASEVEE